MRDILTTRITNYRTQQSASGEAFQVVNGCVAHHSGQVLTIQGKIGSPFREITINMNADVTCFIQHISPKNSVFVSQQFGRKHGQSDNIL
jgi:hypothetical protein